LDDLSDNIPWKTVKQVKNTKRGKKRVGNHREKKRLKTDVKWENFLGGRKK